MLVIGHAMKLLIKKLKFSTQVQLLHHLDRGEMPGIFAVRDRSERRSNFSG